MSTDSSDPKTHIEDDDFLNPKPVEATRLDPQLVNALRNRFRKANKYSFLETKTRNIIMVGRTRSGKSTAIGVLKDPCFEPKDMSIFSETFDPDFRSFALDDKTNQTKYTFNVIDTPGLKEVKAIGTKVRDDDEIIHTISFCLKNEITKINTLVIFISFELGVTNDDVDSFKNFLDRFAHESVSVIVCITRAEDKTDSWKEKIQTQLKSHPYFAEVLKKPNIQICFLGCVDSVKNNSISKEEDLQQLYAKVYQMRKELLLAIFSAETQVRLVELPIAQHAVTNVRDLFAKQKELLQFLSNCTDFGLSTSILKVEEFGESTRAMTQYQHLLAEPELNEEWVTVKYKMEQILVKNVMPEPLRKTFIGAYQLSDHLVKATVTQTTSTSPETKECS